MVGKTNEQPIKMVKRNKRTNHGRQGSTSGNSTYMKLAVQWLNEALFFVSSSVLVDSFMLRNQSERKAQKRFATFTA
jgi:hypothetical protein